MLVDLDLYSNLAPNRLLLTREVLRLLPGDEPAQLGQPLHRADPLAVLDVFAVQVVQPGQHGHDEVAVALEPALETGRLKTLNLGLQCS